MSEDGEKRTFAERAGGWIGTAILCAVWIYIAFAAFEFLVSAQDTSRDTRLIVATLAVACMLIHRVGTKISELRSDIASIQRRMDR